MKVGDLVKRTEKARMPEHAGFLCAETSLGLLERKQVERMPEFICVAGDRNQSWGLLSRELLLFLLRKQEDGFLRKSWTEFPMEFLLRTARAVFSMPIRSIRKSQVFRCTGSLAE